MKAIALFILISIMTCCDSFAQSNISSITKQEKKGLTLYAGIGYQFYVGDMGNGLYKTTENCYWGAGSIGLDYAISNSFDVKFLNTVGDIGYYPTDRLPHSVEGEPHQHGVNLRAERLNARVWTASLALQYNLANDKLLKRDSYIKPSVYGGFGFARLTDIMKMQCINPGMYTTYNAGMSLDHDLNEFSYIGVKWHFGFFTSDKLDYFDDGPNDYHMQNSIVYGIHF